MVYERFLDVQTSKQHGKKLAVGQGPLAAGAPSHGKTGTMVNPALTALWPVLIAPIHEGMARLS